MTFKSGPVTVDLLKWRATVNDQRLELPLKEFRCLALLVSRPDVVLSRDKIIDEVWGEGTVIYPRCVDTVMSKLRKKLGDQQHHLVSIHGVGYKWLP